MVISKNSDNIKPNIVKFRISNFLSLHNVVLPLNPLTVLVGPNGSGKSNIIEAFSLLREILTRDDYPEGQKTIKSEYIYNRLWAGDSNFEIVLQLETKICGKHANYKVRLNPFQDTSASFERLVINDIEVINVTDGRGVVRDEDDGNSIAYKSGRPALKSAGDYGNKPITSILSDFILNWSFFDFKPEVIREGVKPGTFEKIFQEMAGNKYNRFIRRDGSNLHSMLTDWYENDRERYDSVCMEFSRVFKDKVRMDCQKKANEKDYDRIISMESYPNPISFQRSSDGALRMLAYHVLNNQPDIPCLIAIEEPEKNFHPAWLPALKDILNQLSQKTQVIITTHSSQLLDAFSSKELNDNLSVLLLHNIPGSGTEIIPLDNIQKDREGVKGWMNEFGMGSAIFDSELLQDILEA